MPTFLDVVEALDAALDALLAAADADELSEDAMLAAEEVAAELADAEPPVLAALDPAGVAKMSVSVLFNVYLYSITHLYQYFAQT